MVRISAPALTCPHCTTRLVLPGDGNFTRVSCTYCGATFAPDGGGGVTPATGPAPPSGGGITLHGILAAAFFVAGTITLVAPVPPLTLSGPAGWFTAGLLCIVTDRLTRLLNLSVHRSTGH